MTYDPQTGTGAQIELTEAAKDAMFYREQLFEVLGILRNTFRTGHSPEKQRDIAKQYVEDKLKEARNGPA